jgi:hypothetical protein
MDRMPIGSLNILRDLPIFTCILCIEESNRTKKEILPIVAKTAHVMKKDVMHRKHT